VVGVVLVFAVETMSKGANYKFYTALSRICWLAFVFCVFLGGFAMTATYAPSGLWLLRAMVTVSLAGGCISLALALWSGRRARRDLP